MWYNLVNIEKEVIVETTRCSECNESIGEDEICCPFCNADFEECLKVETLGNLKSIGEGLCFSDQKDKTVLLDEYEERYSNPSPDVAKRILFSLMDNILGRSGYVNVWDSTQSKDKEKLLQTNLEMIRSNMTS